MKELLSSCAVLLVAMFMDASPAAAFSTQLIYGTNSDGAARLADPDEKTPVLGSNEGSTGGSVHAFKFPSFGGTADKSPPENSVKGSTFSPEETRLLFGPFNRFGYPDSN